MPLPTLAVCLGVALVGAGCGQPEGAPPPDPAAFEAELMAADRAFDRDTQARGSSGWIAHFEASGAMIQQGVGEIRGPEAIVAAVAGLDTQGFDLTWEPERAQGSTDGTLGYTVGRYVSTATSGADTVRAEGLYVSIWRRQADGGLKVVMDLGNPTG